MTSSIIKAELLSKIYQKGAVADIFRTLFSRMRDGDLSFYALRDVSFELGAGETLGVIGPNRAGKSTLLKILCGVTRQTSGRVIVNGRVAPLIEVGAGFHPELTGKENVFLNGAILGMSRSEIKSNFERIVDFAELWDFIDTPVKKYSSGMFVRLGFAIAVHLDPDVLLVDEVLAVGDVQFQMKCYRKISELREAGKAIVLVTHDMGAILRHCDRAMVLDEGKVLVEATPHSAVDRYLALLSTVSKRGSPAEKSAELHENMEALEFPVIQTAQGSRETIEHDLCPGRPGYNKSEFRYGNGGARIIDFKILDFEGRERTQFKSGEAVIFKVECKFYTDVENPVFGFFIRTIEGIEIYGINTLYQEINLKKIEQNEMISVEFRQNQNLQAGDYFLSTGIAQITPNNIIAIDRRYDLACIQILPVDKTTGIVNFNTKIKIERIK
jgi:ABC-type polysaccharide/polyol phosphate transport system ATPase subunit